MSQSGRQPTTRKERRAAERAASRTPSATGGPATSPWRSPVALISIGVVIVGGVLLALLLLSQGGGGGKPIRTVETVTPPELRDGRSLGSADAPVLVEVYADPQCPVCGRFTREIEPLVLAKYVKDGTVRMTYKDFVFIGPESQDAAVGMRAAEQLAGKFWDYHDIVFENQAGENQGAFSRDRLGQMAVSIGLDKTAFLDLLDDPGLVDAVKAETTGGSARGVNQTPTLFVNGQIMAGLPRWEDLSARIDAAAAAARATSSPEPSAAASTPEPSAVP